VSDDGKLLSQGFIETRLRSTLTKFFGRYYHFALPYRVSVTTMAKDICNPWHLCHKYVSCDIGDIMTSTACGAGNAYPSGTPDFTSVFI